MDPITIITTVISLIEGISTTYNIISTIIDLPRAFEEVKKHLPLVKETLGDVEKNLKTATLTASQRDSIVDIVNDCKSKTEDLSHIFNELERKCQQGHDTKSWTRVRTWYLDALRGVKGHRVESLMNEILEDLKKLSLHQSFKLATKAHIEEIKAALDELAKVEPSLEDEEIESRRSIFATQNVAANATGQQNAPSGGTNTFNSSKYQLHNITGNINFGVDPESQPDKCLQDLHKLVTNHEDYRKRIQLAEGLKDSCSWVFSNANFQRWRDDEQGQLLWIIGGPGRGKTMLLCGIMDELHPPTSPAEGESSALLSYFFCNSKASNATTVLWGLIFQLALRQPALRKHIWQKYRVAGESLYTDDNSWMVSSDIMSNMLRDTGLQKTYLIVDGVDQLVPNPKELLEFVYNSFKFSRAKWIISCRNWNLHNTHSPYQGRLSVELNNESVSAAVDIYIDDVLSRLVWLERNTELWMQVRTIIRQKANATFLWVALVGADLHIEDRASVLCMLKDVPTKLDQLLRVKELLEEGYGKLSQFKQLKEKPSQSRSLLELAKRIYLDALSQAINMEPPYKIGMFRAYIHLAECDVQLSHCKKFSLQEKLKLARQATQWLRDAVAAAEATGNKQRIGRAKYEKAILNARRVLLEHRLDSADRSGRVRVRFNAARDSLTVLKGRYEQAGNRVFEEGVNYWLQRLERDIGGKLPSLLQST